MRFELAHDLAPDAQIEDAIAEDRADAGEDLLDDSRPTEERRRWRRGG